MPSSPNAARVGEGFDDVMAAAQAGAEWAVAVLYRSLQPRLLRFLRAQAPAHDAEDIASQAWLEVARTLPFFAGDEDGFGALVFTVARRRLADHRRAVRRRPLEFVGDEALATVADRDVAEDEALARLGGEEAARRLTELLSPDQAEVVLLRVVAGLSVEQVAALLGRRPGTVRVLQHRALRRLARQLHDDL
ncbi:MAG: RNA polymerase sigma factor [Actinomycetota bacterium]|nr:RNA polymerase sigma factor [Actinomycetota bacterium]